MSDNERPSRLRSVRLAGGLIWRSKFGLCELDVLDASAPAGDAVELTVGYALFATRVAASTWRSGDRGRARRNADEDAARRAPLAAFEVLSMLQDVVMLAW